MNDGSISDTFQNYPDHSSDVFNPAYGLLKQKNPFACDGNYEEDKNDCYIYQDGQWQKSVSLPVQSRWGGTTVLNETTLWIAGNFEAHDMKLSLLINPFEETVQAGPELPYNIRTQCMINMDEDRVMFIGGFDGFNTLDATRIYSFAQNSWEMGPTLTTERIAPACALITLGDQKVIFATQDNSTEYLELNNAKVWKQGKTNRQIR